jgi:putative addiction module killer protein
LAGGVFEFKIDFGPGYRIYFGKDGNTVIILLGGGSKKRQSKDIEDAIFRLNDYRERKLRRK